MNAEPVDVDSLRDPLRATDLGNAERFAETHHSRARFSSGLWYVWDGRRWKRDDTEAVRRLARSTIKSLYLEAADLDDPKERSRMAKWARQSESSKSVTAMLRESQADVRIATSADRFDSPATRYLFNCLNGTLDIRTGELHPHDPAQLITRLAPVEYKTGTDTSAWNTFLATILPDADVRAFLQRYIGSSLSGDTADQQFVVLHGTGANGKSTFISVILSLLGDYGLQANFDTFLAQEKRGQTKNQARPDLIALKGARFVAAVEAEAGRRLDETTIKSLTGGDSLTARSMYRDDQTFQPECKIALVANNRPEVWGNNHAIWRRVLEVPFTVTIPPNQQDASLKDTLCSALSPVLEWATLGALDWFERPSPRLAPPEPVQSATADYRDEENTIGPFLDAKTRRDPSAWTAGKTLWSSYLAFCEDEKTHPIGRKTFSRLIEGAGFRPQKGTGASSPRGFRGIECVENDPTLGGF
jgi:putative DNA primase/helicase